jgi:hypothetical protein
VEVVVVVVGVVEVVAIATAMAQSVILTFICRCVG